ncbi:DUF523 domain-containing protein [Clostridium botulinum]|uniref:Uncharacterized protein n=1 Tax=Clostridium botulinum (strain Hall / ATCC 3502 / NCTC 13319 / Type A) TaxID=441771 RepID=A5I6K1_CLOBH|nr:DUF523 domain-containing protein [Clostridium botulinum]EPS46954.1 hypothetical protein CFSAN002369_24617 [Clostridium botulinum CFSAN002369]EPS47145.1 hypothetical protein CFSAN002367_24846 [Clostridium botulinum CFSAN002367]ABS33042.1 conserved hypothetical protein [Clostridium botulinum A str. ATCC 19397]ABS38346.1 conserved hypothetical protein [Clostridium botulinum A str. Hall]AWB18935.1 DUF523 domain-containing protein [Clostridium botulinum]
MILISACLCGVNCKYNGGNNLNEKALKLFREGKAVLVCPEQLGGQQTPRAPHEINNATGAEVLDEKANIIGPEGDDVTREFLKGAYETLKIAKECDAKVAILKARSPSCGFGKIYDGTFSGNKKDGNGVTAELLTRNGIKVYTEENIDEIYEKIYK